MKIPVEKCTPNPEQPRKYFDDEYIRGLAQSIKEEGQKEPITVEDNGDGSYTLVTGECRLRAHKLLGMATIDAKIRPPTNHDGLQRLTDAMIENVTRENMNAVDEGNGYKAMKQKGMSVKKISLSVGKNEIHIRNRMMIADMEPEIQQKIAEGRLPHDPDALRALMSVPAESRVELALKLAAHDATIKMVKRACFNYAAAKRDAKEKVSAQQTPALTISGLTQKPPEWDALYQINRVPEWPLFTESVMLTCDRCNLRPVASDSTCRACPLVAMCMTILEKTK